MFYISTTLSRMLEAAGIDAARSDKAMTARGRRRMGGMIGRDHFPRLIRQATGVAIARIVRRDRRILIETGDGRIRYHERSAQDCVVIFPGVLSETAKCVTVGMPFGKVARLGPLDAFLGDRLIAGYEDCSDEWSIVRLAVPWIVVRD